VKQVLVLGAGKSSPFLIAHLLELATRHDWFVTVGDVDVECARLTVDGHARGAAVSFDVNDATLRSTLIEQSDVVVNMLSPVFQDLVAWDCVAHGRHMLSVSYDDEAVRDLSLDAQRKGVLLLTDLGLDPGIDHMSAMRLMGRIREEGGLIQSFRSYGSGIPAPEGTLNPFRYVVSWNPRNVVMSAEHGAQYMQGGKIKIVPYHHVFHHTWAVDVPGVGVLEAYPNRDSLSYMKVFGLDEVQTMIRGTLRYPGWCETWAQIVRLGLPNETLRIPDLARRTYAEVVEMHLPMTVSEAPLEQRIANFLQISPTGSIMERLHWLGLLSDEPTGCQGETAASMMVDLLSRKLPLEPGQRDMVVLVHELEVDYPGQDRPSETVTSTMVERGEPDGFTAMARTVGLPTAVTVKLLLEDGIPLTGSQIPTHPSIYEPVLKELEAAGISFTERVVKRDAGGDSQRGLSRGPKPEAAR
jgi:saccharopine dehydrogenase-like NADP-dependent oxidoreductase